jgi:hypothetical protein
MIVDKIKESINKLNWRKSEKWLTVVYLGFQLLLMFINPIASMAMGIFLIAVLLAANNF